MGIPQHEPPHSVRVGRREQEEHRRSIATRPENRPFDPSGVEHCSHIIHLHVEGRNATRSVGQPRPALVEENDTRKRDQRLGEAAPVPTLPPQLEVLEEVRREEDVDRPVADHLVGDVRAAAPGVVGLGNHAAASVLCRERGDKEPRQ